MYSDKALSDLLHSNKYYTQQRYKNCKEDANRNFRAEIYSKWEENNTEWCGSTMEMTEEKSSEPLDELIDITYSEQQRENIEK